MAWAIEMRSMHARLRQALLVTQSAVEDGRSVDRTDGPAGGDLALFCRGFCTALDEHHRGEDRLLFPAIVSAHPELAPVLAALTRDHSMVAYRLQELGAAIDRDAEPEEVERHLAGWPH